MKTDAATLKRVYAMSLAGVYPHYVVEAEKKGRTKAEVDQMIRWLTDLPEYGFPAVRIDGREWRWRRCRVQSTSRRQKEAGARHLHPVDTPCPVRYTDPMEVNLSPDLEGKLARAAGRRGVSADVLIREAIERAVDYEDWFIREVEKGLAQIDAGQVLTHDAVGARLEQKLDEHQSRR